MGFSVLSTLFLIFVLGKTESSRDTDFHVPFWYYQSNVCEPGPKGRVPWILNVREPDYGWRDHTHRATIALAVNDYKGTNDEMEKMGLQLEVELTRALFRNKTHPVHDSDLALYIHALLAVNKNPRDFHGTDLVADLLHRVGRISPAELNPFLVLTLCNAHAIEYEHLDMVSRIVNRTHPAAYDPNVDHHPDVDSREAQMKALAYKAFACAAKYKVSIHKFQSEMKMITHCLHRKYNETSGSFGNVYTTALAVQAFTAVRNPPSWWSSRKSLEYLERESEIDVNLIKAYYIEMALNAKKYNFIRELYKGVPTPRTLTPQPNTFYVQYTIKKGFRPDMYHTLTMNVVNGTSFYNIMKMASNVSSNFNFKSYISVNDEPMVYSVSDLPNDVEENKFWRLCKQYSVNHNTHESITEAFGESPARLIPKPDEHFMYLYSNTECPK